MYLLLCPDCKKKDNQLVNLLKDPDCDQAFCPNCGFTVTREELEMSAR